jgi:PPIC-type PPIASE domain
MSASAVQHKVSSSWPDWVREPLLHFLVLGGLLFAADHYLVTKADDPHTIVVGAAVDKEARDTFKATRGHDPSAPEMAALRRVWLDNEVLYREGLALQVDKGDIAIRERVIFKALSVVDANTKLPPVDDKVLRQWFDGHRAKYDEPARFDFQEAVLSGETSEEAVRAFVATLNAGTPGDVNAGLRVFKARPRSNLVQSYGADFAKALEAAPAGEWRAQQSKEGWRAIRVDAIKHPQAASFEALRPVVLQDWTDATLSEQRSAAVRALEKKYKVKFEGSPS